MSDKVKVGIIGCGNISQAYFNAGKKFEILDIVSCADLNMDAAKAKAEENSVKAVTVDELIADPEIEIVLNLTIPAAHAEINMRALEAGKHAYTEKPFAVDLEEGKKVVKYAKEKGLLTGCAPDTFLGGGLQTCRKLIDDNWLGKVIGGTAFMMGHGPESWHPNPAFFYQTGGGPMLDMGPYYMTALVHLLGPVKKITGVSRITAKERIATSEAAFGEVLKVEVPTHETGIIEFHNGSIVSVTISFDVWGHQRNNPIELYGTDGSIAIPDPNTFGGPVKLLKPGKEWAEMAFSHKYTDNMRSIGMADMAYAIRTGRKHRCSGDLALHVLEVMYAFRKSSEAGAAVELETTCEQPAALPLGLIEGRLD